MSANIEVSSNRGGRGNVLKKIIFFLKILKWTIFFSILGIIISFSYFAYKKYSPLAWQYYDFATNVVTNSTTSDFRSEQTSYIYDNKGKQIAKLKTDRDVNYVYYSDLTEDVINATISIEDRRFWEHDGVDWKSTAKAGVLYLKDRSHISRGGSTITQQLVKNIYLSYEQKIERKAKEILIALQLEKKYTKRQILEFYLNNINYSNGYYGINTAAKGYFNKKVKDLSLEEAAFLCAIPNNPSLYDPFTHIENTIKRKNIILTEMYNQGYIGENEYLRASNAPIHFYKRSSKTYNYEVSYAIDCAVRSLMSQVGFPFQYKFASEKEFKRYQKQYAESYQEARARLYTGGYKVYTSLDSRIQKRLQKSIDNNLKSFKSKTKDGVYELQGAGTVIDNKNGKVIALVGGRSQNFHGVITLNRAYQSYRQPGSTFKPLAVYSPALENGYTPETKVVDEYFDGGPHNSGNSYDGEIPLRTAVEKSKNVIAWKTMAQLGAENCLGYVQKMHFSKIVPSDYYLSSSLGGLTYGVSTVEMASGYRTLANDGVFTEPTCIIKIKTANNDRVSWEPEEYRVYSEDAARTMTDILTGVAKKGTASGLTLGTKMPIACKTGTTNNQTNGWFCGYTPYYTMACYVGFDQSKSLAGLWGATYPLYVWRDVQTFLNAKKAIIAFKKVEKPKVKVASTEKPDVGEEAKTNVESRSSTLATPVVTPKSEIKPVETLKPTPKPAPVITPKPTPAITPEPISEVTLNPTPEPVIEPTTDVIETPNTTEEAEENTE